MLYEVITQLPMEEDYIIPTPTRRMRRIIPLRRTTIDAEAELTRLLVEEIIEESVSNLREYTDEEYPDQAG